MHHQIISITAIEKEDDVQLRHSFYQMKSLLVFREDLYLRDAILFDGDDVTYRAQVSEDIMNSSRCSLTSSLFL